MFPHLFPLDGHEIGHAVAGDHGKKVRVAEGQHLHFDAVSTVASGPYKSGFQPFGRMRVERLPRLYSEPEITRARDPNPDGGQRIKQSAKTLDKNAKHGLRRVS